MKIKIAKELKQEAEHIAKTFSDKKRELNQNQETFTLDKITPMSEYTAVAVYRKSSGKFAIYFMFYVKNKWFGFFPTDSHLEGMKNMTSTKQKIEEANYSFNFSNWTKGLSKRLKGDKEARECT